MKEACLSIILLLLTQRLVDAQSQKLVTSAGCSSTKGCYKSPADCTDVDDCDVMVTWAPVAGSDLLMTIEILGKIKPGQIYVGVGFSHDEYMGGDDVWSCVYSADQVAVDHSVNHGKHNMPLQLADGTVTNFEGVMADSAIQCRFTRPKAVIIQTEGSDPENFNLDEDYHIFIARAGPYVMNGMTFKGKHYTVPIISENKIDFNSLTVVSGVAPRPILLKAHGSLMVFGWIGCASIAILLAKYFKIIWPNASLCGEKVWFALHRSLMMINFLCFVGGFVVVFVHVGGFVPYLYMDQTIFIHAACGIAATALGVVNPLMAMLRPHPGTKRRPFFNWAHWGVGTAAHILAIACVIIGIDLEMLDLPEYAFWVMIAFVLFHVVMDILLKLVIGFAQNGVERRRGEQYEIGKNGDLRQVHGDEKSSPPGSCLATTLIILHVIGVLGIVTTMIVTIALM